MSADRNLRALAWMVRETFFRACASRLLWLMLTGSAIAIAVCSSVRIEGGQVLRTQDEIELYGGDGQPLAGANPLPGHLTLAFGAVRVNLFRDGPGMVHFLEVLLGRYVAGATGCLLALVWTAGFVPEFLRSEGIAVFLAKPVSRRVLLWGQAIGVLGFVGAQAAVFVVGTWLALALRTGIWSTGYLWALPLLCLHFGMIYGISVLLGVWSRDAAIAAVGTVVFWLVCCAVDQGRDAVKHLPATAQHIASCDTALGASLEAAYWVLPKPIDLSGIFDEALDNTTTHPRGSWKSAEPSNGAAGSPMFAIVTSLVFGALLVEIAARAFTALDY